MRVDEALPLARLRPALVGDVSPTSLISATKVSWRGRYSRHLLLSDGCLLTIDPKDSRVTNIWDLPDIRTLTQRGAWLEMWVGGLFQLKSLRI